MGLFCVNFHFRTRDQSAVDQAMEQRGAKRRKTLPSQGDWTAVYEEQASNQDDERVSQLIKEVSADLRVPAIAFLVHDSDVACYWLCESGRMLDEYNSCPDYFEDSAGDEGPSGGSAEALLKFCRPGISADELSELLQSDPTFADGIVERLAEALGIDPERALSDYRDFGDDDDFGDEDSDDEGDDGDDGDAEDIESSRDILPFRNQIAKQLERVLGAGRSPTPVDPQVQELIDAIAADDPAKADRILQNGVAVDGVALTTLPKKQSMAGLGQIFAGEVPKMEMTPLLTAVTHGRLWAANKLLDAGADPNQSSLLLGTPVHAATGNGDVEMLKLLLDRGGNPTSKNQHGQTPLQVLLAARGTLDQLANAQSMLKSMGMSVPKLVEQLAQTQLPVEGWAACEALLRSRIDE
jgi:hypothetical protein